MPLLILIFWRAITQSVIFMLKHKLYIDILAHLTEQTESCLGDTEFRKTSGLLIAIWVDSVPRPVNNLTTQKLSLIYCVSAAL